jgi:hypothetical protein
MADIVKSVLLVSRNGEEGIKIDVGYEISVLIDTFSRCCEFWGLDLNGINVFSSDGDSSEPSAAGVELANSLVGSRVMHVGWNNKRQKKLDCNGMRYFACVDIVYRSNRSNDAAADDVLEIDIWCNHNGYYPHTVFTKWKDHEDEQEL